MIVDSAQYVCDSLERRAFFDKTFYGLHRNLQFAILQARESCQSNDLYFFTLARIALRMSLNDNVMKYFYAEITFLAQFPSRKRKECF